MEAYVRNNMLKKIFLYLVDYINNKSNRKINIVLSRPKISETKSDSDMFFNVGQLIMFLYIGDAINYNNIIYNDREFYVDSIYSTLFFCDTYKEGVSSKEIADYIIRKSVYNKSFLPKGIEKVTAENLQDILDGFQYVYGIFMNEKRIILKYLEEYKFSFAGVRLIKYIELLNPNDMRRQVKFISLKIEEYYENIVIKNLMNVENNSVNINEEIMDLYIQNAIIGYGKHGMELMWIEYKDKTIRSMEKEILYMAMLLAYVGHRQKNKYYIENSKQCINSILSSSYYNDLLDEEYINLIYVLNRCIKYEKLDRFIESNYAMFQKMLKKKNKRINIDKYMLEFYKNGKLNAIESIII